MYGLKPVPFKLTQVHAERGRLGGEKSFKLAIMGTVCARRRKLSAKLSRVDAMS